MFAKFALAVAALMLSGCATMFGTAMYAYENGDCKVTVASRRDVGGPVDVGVDKDCNLTAKTGSLQGGQISPKEVADSVVAGVKAGASVIRGETPEGD